MTLEELRVLITDAFREVARPEKFTGGCVCDECKALEKSFRKFVRGTDCIQITGMPSGIEWALPLLSPEAWRFLMPGFLWAALQETNDDLSCSLIDMLSTPIKKNSSPDILPFASGFSYSQILAVLKFLRHIDRDWYDANEERPREMIRALKNWEHFLNRAQP